MANQSVVIVAPAADRDNGNNALAAYFGDDYGSQNLSIALSASGQLPATHWLCHIWLAPASATAIKDWPSGTLPTPVADWSGYNLDAASALTAGQTFIVGVMSATDQNFQTLPQTNVDAVMTALGVQRIV